MRFLSPLWAKGSWGFLELVGLGFAGYFWLGLGYWVYPTAMGLAGLLRLYNRFAGENREGNYVRLDETLDKMATPVAAEPPSGVRRALSGRAIAVSLSMLAPHIVGCAGHITMESRKMRSGANGC